MLLYRYYIYEFVFFSCMFIVMGVIGGLFFSGIKSIYQQKLIESPMRFFVQLLNECSYRLSVG